MSGYVLENYKPAIFVVNKWDLLKEQLATGQFADYLRKVFPSLDFVPIAFITAKDGKNVQQVLDLGPEPAQASQCRASAPAISTVWCRRSTRPSRRRMRQNRQGRIYFATQAATNPPLIVLFTNGPQLFDNTYQRYLLKNLRDHLPFRDVAIKMYLRAKPTAEDKEDQKPRAKPTRLRGTTEGQKGQDRRAYGPMCDRARSA